MSHTEFNRHMGLAIVCPLPSKDRGFPFQVAVLNRPEVTGFVMIEKVKSIDFCVREALPIGKASSLLLDEVLCVLDACIY